ncbi:MAG: RNA polymerase sigma factor SigZ [Candidatus Latescibacteria bacterium]|nr:RNA polymerase sigma factor SigZ [Candidatus Latescibacterota bacterium]
MNSDAITTEQLWALLGAKLRNFLLKRVSDEQVAQDLLQETFLRVHKGLDGLNDRQRLTPWVFQIARNLATDHYRSRIRDAAIDGSETDIDAEEENLNELVAGWLPQMIAQLPEVYRQAVELYELKGLPQQDIADRLGLSLSGAKSRIQRGRTQLKSLLLACCSFERDRRGNFIDYSPNDPEDCAC